MLFIILINFGIILFNSSLAKREGKISLIFPNIQDIIYFEAQNQYIMIYTTAGSHLVRYNIGDFEEQLKGDGFFRTHRGFLVSLAKVKRLVKSDVLMDTPDGEVSVPVSRSNLKAIKEALYAYVESSAF